MDGTLGGCAKLLLFNAPLPLPLIPPARPSPPPSSRLSLPGARSCPSQAGVPLPAPYLRRGPRRAGWARNRARQWGRPEQGGARGCPLGPASPASASPGGPGGLGRRGSAAAAAAATRAAGAVPRGGAAWRAPRSCRCRRRRFARSSSQGLEPRAGAANLKVPPPRAPPTRGPAPRPRPPPERRRSHRAPRPGPAGACPRIPAAETECLGRAGGGAVPGAEAPARARLGGLGRAPPGRAPPLPNRVPWPKNPPAAARPPCALLLPRQA